MRIKQDEEGDGVLFGFEEVPGGEALLAVVVVVVVAMEVVVVVVVLVVAAAVAAAVEGVSWSGAVSEEVAVVSSLNGGHIIVRVVTNWILKKSTFFVMQQPLLS